MPGGLSQWEWRGRGRDQEVPASVRAEGSRRDRGGSEKEEGISFARRSCSDQGIFQAAVSEVLGGWLEGKNGFL